MAVETEKWKHGRCRSPKDGLPVFDGRRWYCSRCETGYYVNINGCSQAEADEMFERFLANVSFVVVQSTDVQRVVAQSG